MQNESKEQSGKIFDAEILSKIYQFVKPYKSKFYLLIFLTIFVGFLTPFRPLIIQKTFDACIVQRNADGLVNLSLIILGLIIVQAILEYATTYISGWLGQTLIRDIRQALYNHLIRFKTSFFDKTPIGRLITRNISDIEAISDIFTEGIASIAGDLLQLFFILIIMFYTNWKLALISLSVIPLLLISTYIFKEKVKNSFNLVRTAVANLNSFTQEHISGMSIVQIFNREKIEYEKFKIINKEHLQSNLKSVLYYSVYFPIAEVLAAAGTGLLVWWGAQEVLENEITLGTLIAFLMYIAMFFRPIRVIADKFNTLQMGIVCSSRVLKLLEDNSYLATSNQQIILTKIESVEFIDVWFAYDEDNYVLKNINFKILSGENIAIVGATGSGKSTIIQLLNRNYDISKGSILINNIDIKNYSLDSLRKSIGFVLQDVFLFSDSIKNNITLGNKNITDEEFINTCQYIGIDIFAQNLPNQYNYNVRERGATLSVGQRQLISFARAMIYKPSLMILDEATSSIDSEKEELIQITMDKILKNQTSIVIAHRLSTIQNASKIIVLNHGEIVEVGNHEYLLSKNGYYAELCKIQFHVHNI